MNRGVDVGVIVDEPGRHDESGGVQHDGGSFAGDTLNRNGDDAITAQCHVRAESGLAGSVHYRSSADQDVILGPVGGAAGKYQKCSDGDVLHGS